MAKSLTKFDVGRQPVIILVRTMMEDEFINYYPRYPLAGQIFIHNIQKYDSSIPYENTSSFYFDNFHKFKSTPQDITLQFILGKDDDGSSIRPLLKKLLYYRKYKPKLSLHIYRNFKEGIRSNFFMPYRLMSKFKWFGFRFDTDYISKGFKMKYHDLMRSFPIIRLEKLDKNLQELHLGQKLRVRGYNSLRKLSSITFECCDLESQISWYLSTIFVIEDSWCINTATRKYPKTRMLKLRRAACCCFEAESEEEEIRPYNKYRRHYIIQALDKIRQFFHNQTEIKLSALSLDCKGRLNYDKCDVYYDDAESAIEKMKKWYSDDTWISF
ncbi:uncharacterized protein RJT21DRAFT_58294 [Scheffersomyces amazonensis]|uniref:uncharacterized protein n=1 Tax=Scheffersomyces amazonensis TaxID=1078765 RepID=UPI00315D6483